MRLRLWVVLPSIALLLLGVALATDAAGSRTLLENALYCATDSTCRPLKLKVGDFVNVKDYGAVGNDSTDDRPFIQAAIDALAVGTVVTIGTITGLPFAGEQIVQGGGGVVRFENGKTYKITSALQVPANVTLDLNWSVIKLYGASQNAIVRKHNAGLYADNNISIRNGMIMSGDGAASQNGIVMDTVDHLEFSNLWVRGFVGVGLWLKKCQYMVATKLRFTDCTTTGTGIRFDINTDNFGSHENKIYGLFTEGCGIGAYISGFNNSIIGGSVSVSTTAGIKVEGLGSEGTQATHITGVKFEGSDTAFDILNLATHTAITECMFIVPPTPANKTKRFIRQEAGDILVTNSYSQASNLAIAGSAAVIEHFGGKTRVQGGQFGVALLPDQLVVDETASRTSAKVTNDVFVSARGDGYQSEDAFGTMSIRRATTTDSLLVGIAGESLARFDVLSDGRIFLGQGTVLDTIIQRDGSGNLQITPGGTNVVAPAYKVNSTTGGGTITLSTGSGTATVLSGHRCVCTDTTANVSVKCAVSATTLTATGTGSDVIAYVCF
jgi:hypothetical protein